MAIKNMYILKALEVAVHSGKSILEIYDHSSIQLHLKEDKSPLTRADIASNEIINYLLSKSPYPIISEENKQIDYSSRNSWKTYWIVDPLDGTKEFIKKNGEFTVNIALCSDGRPIFGVIYVPVTRELYYGNVKEKVAYKTIVGKDHQLPDKLFLEKDRIYPSTNQSSTIRVVGSRSHMNQDTLDYVEALKNQGKKVEVVSKGSSLKFCLVAEGKADVYPRFAPTMEWDTAAGHAICTAVGLKVTAQDTQRELCYNKENLLNPYFLVST